MEPRSAGFIRLVVSFFTRTPVGKCRPKGAIRRVMVVATVLVEPRTDLRQLARVRKRQRHLSKPFRESAHDWAHKEMNTKEKKEGQIVIEGERVTGTGKWGGENERKRGGEERRGEEEEGRKRRRSGWWLVAV